MQSSGSAAIPTLNLTSATRDKQRINFPAGSRFIFVVTTARIRCIGRTDDMLIYRSMDVFPTAINDLIATSFAGSVEPLIRIIKQRADQVRFDDPIPVQLEIKTPVSAKTNLLASFVAAKDPFE